MIASGSGDIISSAGRLEGLLDDMTSQVQNRLQAAWHGGASGSYQVMQQRWNSAAADVRSALLQLGQAFGDAGTGMQGADRQNQARFV
jgi:WXG100 family type VII secretion target